MKEMHTHILSAADWCPMIGPYLIRSGTSLALCCRFSVQECYRARARSPTPGVSSMPAADKRVNAAVAWLSARPLALSFSRPDRNRTPRHLAALSPGQSTVNVVVVILSVHPSENSVCHVQMNCDMFGCEHSCSYLLYRFYILVWSSLLRTFPKAWIFTCYITVILLNTAKWHVLLSLVLICYRQVVIGHYAMSTLRPYINRLIGDCS